MSIPKKRHLLTNMAFDEVSLVDKGANQHAKVVFSKRHDEVGKMSPTPGDVHADGPMNRDEDDDDDEVMKFRDEVGVMKYRRSNDVMSPRPGNVTHTPSAGGAQMGVNAEDLPAEVVDYIQKSESYIDSLEARLAEVAKGGDAHKEDDMDDVEKALSSLDDNQRAVFAAIHKRAQEAEEVAKQERALRLDREFNDRAAALDALPVEKSEVTDLFKSLAERAPEALDLVESVLSKANESVKATGVFEERGSSLGAGTAGDDVISHITKTAEVSMTDGLSPEQAIAKALDSNPALYDQYLAERG